MSAEGTLRFLVTGCSRSGTGYTARLFLEMGIPCGHESIFNIHRIRPGGRLPPLDHPHLVGDSSFLAVPFLARLPARTLVLHQVRNPIDVIRSHMGIRFFSEPYQPSVDLAENHEDFLDVIGRAAPEVFRENDERSRCAVYWVRWNLMAERAARLAGLGYVRYRLEDLDVPLVEDLVNRIDLEVPHTRIEEALSRVPRDVNHRSRDDSVSLEELPVGVPRNGVWTLARRYGYALPSPTPAASEPG